MSQIPFVDRLGDAIDVAIAADPKAARRRSRRRVRRVGLLAVAAVLVIGGTVAAAELLTEPEKLAATEVDCLYDPASGGGVGIHPGGQDPVAACRAFLAGQGKALVEGGSLPAVPKSLVACVRPDVGKVVVIAGHQGDCERYKLGALPAEYTPAREQVAELERELRAIEARAECIPLEELTRQVQVLLDRSGWTGWAATPRPDVSDGPCGHVLQVAEGGKRTLELVPGSRQLLVIGESPRATVELLNRLSPALVQESRAGCFTVEALKARVRERFAPTGRQVTFDVAETLSGKGDAAVCAVVQKVGPDHNGRDLVALIDPKR
jgi:hypothetical protein